jgi:hypothetical protein
MFPFLYPKLPAQHRSLRPLALYRFLPPSDEQERKDKRKAEKSAEIEKPTIMCSKCQKTVEVAEELCHSTLKTQFLTQTVRIFNQDETLSRQKLESLEKVVSELRNEISSIRQQNLDLNKRLQQLEAKSKLPVLCVNEETYFAPPLAPLKELRTDEQGQLRLMTPPPSATSVSSMPSPRAFSL